MNQISWGLTLAVIGVMAGCANNTVVSEGDRVGVITKLSRKMLCPPSPDSWSWEGELAMQGGTVAANQGVTEGGQAPVGIWQFSIDPQKPNAQQLVDDARKGLNSGQTVRVSYQQVQSRDTCRSGSDYLVQVISELGSLR